MFRSLLIANRGEISLRIQRTARRLGIRTIAVYSEADRGAMHVRAADEAVCIGAASATDSYLRIDRILEVARASGAEAIHPGYGFLSENPQFAAACRAAGVTFVGPGEHALRVMGSKSLAKEAVSTVGVRTLPGYLGAAQDNDLLQAEAKRIGFPLLVKAVAGGGGKGMRIVRDAAQLPDALSAARREALAAFGDAAVMLERFLDRPRHVEVQVFGDRHGNVVHLFERDCSLQRRHQKVIEEAPAPFLGDELRQTLYSQALAAARAVDYVGAGTVEFLVQDGAAWFIEMNTRLQVEHPVTEAITGLDLVEWQLRVAAGEALPLEQSAIQAHGHAIELRICAEDARQGLLPAVGQLDVFELAGSNAAWRRFDTGFQCGDRITPHYDSMLAKLIVSGADRAAALARAQQALGELRVAGVPSNRSFLQVLLQMPSWHGDGFDTNLIGRELDVLLAAATERDSNWPREVRALLAAALACGAGEWAGHVDTGQGGANPWARHDAFRMNQPAEATIFLAPDAQAARIAFGADGALRVDLPDGESVQLEGWALTDSQIAAEIDGKRWQARLLPGADCCTWVGAEGAFTLALHRPTHRVDGGGGVAAGHVVAPMPGLVLAVHVLAGDRVERGARLLTLEAMKMEHTVSAAGSAVVKAVRCEAGQRVGDSAVLIELEPQA